MKDSVIHKLDSKSRLQQISFSHGRNITLIYDEADRVVEILDSVAGNTSFCYDSLDRLVDISFPCGQGVSYDYDEVNNPVCVRYSNRDEVHYRYNQNGWMTRIITGDGEITYEYDAVGHLRFEGLPNGIQSIYEYDNKGRPIHLTIRGSNKSVLFRFYISYDAVDNRTVIRENKLDSVHTIHYTYDAVHRLISVKRSDRSSEKFRYDQIGNRILKLESGVQSTKNKWFGIVKRPRQKTKYTYDAEGCLTTAGKTKFKYDEKGRLTEKGLDHTLTFYRYDAIGNLIRVNHHDGTHSSYVYDIFGRRLRRQLPDGEVIDYVYDGHRIVQEIKVKGKCVASYIHGPYIDHPVRMTRDGKHYYFLRDPLGSIIALTNEKGEIVSEYEYDSWGNFVSEKGKVRNPFRFAGREWDEENSFYYFRSRYYDPFIGRFITPDRFPGSPYSPQSMNKYSYAENNPTSCVDPLGFSPHRPSQIRLTQPVQSRSKLISPPSIQPMRWRTHSNFQPTLKPLQPMIQDMDVTFQRWNQSIIHPYSIRQMSSHPQRILSTASSIPTLRSPSIGRFLAEEGGLFASHTQSQYLMEYVSSVLPAFVTNPSIAFSNLTLGITILTGLTKVVSYVSVGNIPAAIQAYYLDFAIPVAIAIAGGPVTLVLYQTGKLLWSSLPTSIKQEIGQIIGEVFDQMLSGEEGSAPGGFLERILKELGTTPPSPPPPDQPPPTAVGGVLLDKAAEIVGDIGEIKGAYWDEKLKQIVLISRLDDDVSEYYLPWVDSDLLAVAIRAVWSGESPGVSIDRPPSGSKSKYMPVRYLGNSENTRFGMIMFEADKLLKNLSMGKDNVTGEIVTSSVHDFRNELELAAIYGSDESESWHRMWFFIDDMRLSLKTRETSDRNSLSFSKVALKVKTEYVNGKIHSPPDPAAERFATHFTEHFDEFAKENLILRKLTELAKIVAIAKFLKDTGKPAYFPLTKNHKIPSVTTDSVTPGITVSKTLSQSEGMGVRTLTRSIYGGVDFGFKYKPSNDDGTTAGLRSNAQSSRPYETVSHWGFKHDEENLCATALSLNPPKETFATVETDLSISSKALAELELSRFYDSSNTESSVFGFGWMINIPNKLTVLNQIGTPGSMLLLIDTKKCSVQEYAFVESKASYCMILDQKETESGRTFSFDPVDRIIFSKSSRRFVWEASDGLKREFDIKGRLVSKAGKDGSRVEYSYSNDRLTAISDQTGARILLDYDSEGRIKQAFATDGTLIEYVYNNQGNLSKVFRNKKYTMTYCYDGNRNLVKAVDNVGKVRFRNVFDSLGRLLRKREFSVADEYGNTITRVLNNQHLLLQEENEYGDRICYFYDKERNLAKATFQDQVGRSTVITYEKDEEKPVSVTNPLKLTTRIMYDTRGRVTRVLGRDGNSIEFKWDTKGNCIAICDAMKNVWERQFDKNNRLTAVVNPLGNRMEFSYSLRRVSVDISGDEYSYYYDDRGNLLKFVDANGNSTEFVFDNQGKLKNVRDALGVLTSYQYDQSGKLTLVCDKNGHAIQKTRTP